MSDITIDRLGEADALDLSDLLAGFVTEMRRGAPRKRDRYYVEKLLSEGRIEFLGAKAAGRLVGYALFYDLPDVASGRRRAAVEELFVDVRHRRRGAGSALVAALSRQAATRGWDEIRWAVPQGAAAGIAFSAARAEAAREEVFRLAAKRDEARGEA